MLVCSSQEKSGIEVYWRPLSKGASALVFFSRRSDMPYRYMTSLKMLNYTLGVYKVSVQKHTNWSSQTRDRLHDVSLSQVYDVFSEKPLPELKDSTDFVVSINPSGVVMWYVYPAAEWRKEAGPSRFSEKLRGPKFHRYANEVDAPLVLWLWLFLKKEMNYALRDLQPIKCASLDFFLKNVNFLALNEFPLDIFECFYIDLNKKPVNKLTI